MSTVAKTSLQEDFFEYYKQIESYEEAIKLMAWDLRTKAPKKGVQRRSETLSFLSQKVHELKTSDQIKSYIDQLRDTEDPVVKRSIELVEKDYNKTKKIPVDEFKEFVELTSQAESVWSEAREKSDFELFRPYLEKIVDFNIKFAEYWGYKDNRYDALLDGFEPGVTVQTLDQVFPKLRKDLGDLIHKVNQSTNQPNTEQILKHFPKEKQEQFALKVLEKMGYDFEAGRLDETVHPFAININHDDVRVTTRYDEQDFRMAVFGTIHEGGHALYEQGLNRDMYDTPVGNSVSMGIHESQSLFWENFVGRNETFWEEFYDLFLAYAPDSFKGLPKDEFYRAVNEVKPTFIRIEADEMTYPLHIMIRYELEKGLINEEIEVKDLPKLWNDKMEEYLGIRPEQDADGVLQDVHWSGGDFGYFPSYALGYMYGAQIRTALNHSVSIDDCIKNNDLAPIKDWLNENIHQKGSMLEPLDLLKEVTGEGLNPDHLVNYLDEKYGKIYKW
ncbi:carboxypeptidase M32 [Aquisalibacillus elongatus]|uniref:Metal-dependent carboxypeptidase n=1 Tax=Aquisalibacillus elongatus TaxID=485577 RepID=A0A3N5C162_9BACI|nr:carboxypeptidase M32 [Aquisalibacillus elongatus]RPF55808.1 carboxypeptidase Taq [Aquisalibacillus elongatus]